MTETLAKAPLHDIARCIEMDWGERVHYTALPWLKAMGSIKTLDDRYGFESGAMVVACFLSNAGRWQGLIARMVKAELKRRMDAWKPERVF